MDTLHSYPPLTPRTVSDESVDGSWVMRNDTIQTPGGLQTPQLTSTVLRENPRQAAEHVPDQDSSEPGSEPDYIHKYARTHTHHHLIRCRRVRLGVGSG